MEMALLVFKAVGDEAECWRGAGRWIWRGPGKGGLTGIRKTISVELWAQGLQVVRLCFSVWAVVIVREPRAKGTPYPRRMFETQNYSCPRPEAELKAWELVSDIMLIGEEKGKIVKFTKYFPILDPAWSSG